MSDQPGEKVPSEAAQAWDTVGRVREPVAWTLLVVTAIAVLVSAWQLFGLPGDRLTIAPLPLAVVSGGPGTPIPVPFHFPVASFALRASDVAPSFVSGATLTLPVLAVVLAAFAGGLTNRARQVVQTAAWVLGVTIGLGLISWVGAFGAHQRQGVWFISDALELVAVAAALVFAVAVLRSRALRPVTPQLIDSAEDGADFAKYRADFAADLGDDVVDLGGNS